MADINKLKNKARREEQRENWSRAIELYKRALLESEKERDGAADLSLFNRIGDIHLRLGDKRTAVQFYEQAIQRYAEQDLHTSAIALCNKVLRILPDRVETIRQLGHLQAATGLVAEARGNYLRYAAEQMRHKRVDLALEALEECVEATADQQAGLRLAELFVELGRQGEALQRLQSLRERLAGRGTDVSRLEARISELQGAEAGPESDASWAAEPEEEHAPEATAAEPEGASTYEGVAPVAEDAETPAPVAEEPETDVPAAEEPESGAPVAEEPESGAPAPVKPEAGAPLAEEPETAAPMAESEPDPGVPETSETESPVPSAAAPELRGDPEELVARSRLAPEGTEPGAEADEAVSRGRLPGRRSPGPDLPESTSVPLPRGRPEGGSSIEGPERRKSSGGDVARRLAASGRDRPEPSVLSPAASAERPGSSPREPSERRDARKEGRTRPLAPAARFDPDRVEWEGARRPRERGDDGLAQVSEEDGGSAVALEAEPAETSASDIPWSSAPAMGAEAPEGPAAPSPVGSAPPADAAERRARPEHLSRSRHGDVLEETEAAPAADGDTWMQRGCSARSEGDLPTAIEAFGMALGSPAHLEEAFEAVEACRRELEAQPGSSEAVEEARTEATPEDRPAADTPPEESALEEAPVAEAAVDGTPVEEPAVEAAVETAAAEPAEARVAPAVEPEIDEAETAAEVADGSAEPELEADAATPASVVEATEPRAEDGPEPLATEHLPTIPVTGLPSARTPRPSAAPSGTSEPAGDGEAAAARQESAFLEWVHAAAPALLHSTRRELEARGELRRAAIVLDRLLELEPDRLEMHRARLEYAQRLSDRDGALRAEIGLGACLERSGKESAAREAYERALALEPGSDPARVGLERLGGTGDEKAAVPDVDRHEPEGRSDDRDGPRVHEADESAEREGEVMRHEEVERPGLGKTAVPRGDATAVLDATSPLADRASGDGPVPYDPLSGDAGVVDFEELLSELRTSLADNESVVDTRSHTEMGAELKAMGMLDEAIRELQTAVREPNAPAQAFELLGESFIEKGQARVAAGLLAKAVAERQFGDRESMGVLYQLGVAYQEIGETSKALECYERIFSIDIDFRDIKDRILDCSP